MHVTFSHYRGSLDGISKKGKNGKVVICTLKGKFCSKCFRVKLLLLLLSLFDLRSSLKNNDNNNNTIDNNINNQNTDNNNNNNNNNSNNNNNINNNNNTNNNDMFIQGIHRATKRSYRGPYN